MRIKFFKNFDLLIGNFINLEKEKAKQGFVNEKSKKAFVLNDKKSIPIKVTIELGILHGLQ